MEKITRYTEFSAALYKETGNLTKAEFYESELEKLSDKALTAQ